MALHLNKMKISPNTNVNTLFLLKLIKVLAMFKIWWTSLKKLAFFEIREYFSKFLRITSTNGSQASSGEKSNETDAIDRRQQPLPQ